MKTNQIKRAALAAAILAGVGVAYGQGYSSLQVVYCKATITDNGGNDVVSVTLPPTDGYFDDNGNPLTFWNVGNVPAGGVADSWHGEGGPGRFTAHNEGNVGAYVYVTTGNDYHKVSRSWSNTNTRYDYNYSNFDPFAYQTDHGSVSVSRDYFGDNLIGMQDCAISLKELNHNPWSYHLAFTTDVTAKVPTWHSLDHRLCYTYGSNSTYYWSTEEDTAGSEIAGYMGYLDAGDYMTFDLKFWAPRDGYDDTNVLFTFCVEASTFPLWDHGRAVE